MGSASKSLSYWSWRRSLEWHLWKQFLPSPGDTDTILITLTPQLWFNTQTHTKNTVMHHVTRTQSSLPSPHNVDPTHKHTHEILSSTTWFGTSWLFSPLKQGPPTLGLWISTDLQPVRNWAMQASAASSVHARDLGSARNHGPWKNCFPQNRFLVPKRGKKNGGMNEGCRTHSAARSVSDFCLSWTQLKYKYEL